jgi:hypothetical protein
MTKPTEKELRELWYTEAEEQTMATLPAFLKKLTEFEHDYGSICVAIAAAGVGAMYALNKEPQGGITGFQSGAIFWELRSAWLHKDSPAKILDYEQMLYPQHGSSFNKVISPDTWKWLREQAREKLKKDRNGEADLADSVRHHMRQIALGNPPFGFRVED